MANHFKPQIVIVVEVLLSHVILLCSTNKMDPHVFPEQGPFFEGWYVRIIDPHQNVSLGFMFGRVLPLSLPSRNVDSLYPTAASQSQSESFKMQASDTQIHGKQSDSGNITQPCCLVFLGLLLSLERNEKLQNPEAFFRYGQYNVSIDGRPVVKDPDDESPPNFQVTIASNFSYVVNKTGTWFTVKVGPHVLTGETAGPVPWGPNGQGPEDWLVKLPLSVHWFVYSLGSTVKTYSYMNSETGEAISGGTEERKVPVVAHIEKNWGQSFPKAWVWAEGVNPNNGISFAFAAGINTELGLKIKAQLSGYRNPGKKISLSFNPLTSLHWLDFDACAGKAMLMIESLTHHVIFQVSAPPKSFSSCLSAPGKDGFRKGCVESFVAIANIKVYNLVSKVLIDNQTVFLSALEFGKAYMCKGQC